MKGIILKFKVLSTGMIAALVCALCIGALGANQRHVAPPDGKVTPWQAMKIASSSAKGRAVNATFEFEDGHWIYGVIVVSRGKLKEVEIDATTGKLGDVEGVTPEGEAREYLSDLKHARASGG